MIENLVFGRFGLNSRVFGKLFISYLCILFIKHCALRSFCIKMLCFSKIWFFQIFDWSNLLLDRSKLRLKIWFESTWLDWCWIDLNWFLIDRTYFSTDRKLVIEFFKNMRFSCVLHYFKSFQKFFSHSSTTPDSTSIFCCFSSNFLQGFCFLALVRPFYPFFFGLISFFMHFREIFGPVGFWGFWCLWCFLSQLINGFLLLDDVNMFLIV